MINISIVKIALSLTMLTCTSYLDVKYREVNPKIWIIFGLFGGILTIFEVLMKKYLLLIAIVNIILGFSIGIISYYSGLFGGADFLCLFVLSIMHPYPPIRPIYYVGPMYPFILTIAVNSLLLSLAIPIVNLIRNIKNHRHLRRLKAPLKYKLLYLFIGYPVSIEKYLNMKFAYPLTILELHEDKLITRYRLTFDINEEHQEHQKNLKELIDKGVLRKDDVIWVTQGIPLLVFITLGYIMSLSLGDIIVYMLMVRAL